MTRIVLSTSSSGIEQLDISHTIEFIRLHINVNNVDFIDGKNITPQRLSQLMLAHPSTLCQTYPASHDEVRDQLSDLYDQGYREVFIVALSAAISQSHAIISEVATEFAERMDIYVYDSKTISMAEAALAYEADVLLQEGNTFAEIITRLDALRQAMTLQFTVTDLSHLIKNKQLSMASGFFANLLDIKPVLGVNDTGQIVVVEKIRRIEKSFDHLGMHCKKLMQRANFTYLISCGDSALDDYFINLLSDKYNIRDLPILSISTVSLANHGAHAVGIGTFVQDIPKIAQQIR